MLVTVWTIRAALVFFGLSVLSRSTHNEAGKVDKRSRAFWTLAAVLYIVHVLAAFAEVHGWSHAAAVQHTADQTSKWVGISFGNGIWFNHLFTLLCCVETAWWWVRPLSYQSRSPVISWTIGCYLLFMVINGAVVFVEGPVRWISLGAIVLIAMARWSLRRPR